MPRKTLDKRKECGRLFATARKKAPQGCGAWRYCLTTTFLRGSCQEYRGINSRLYDYFYVHFNFIYRRFIRYRISIRMIFVVKEIILYDDEIKIVYNSPIKIGPDDSQGFSFYNKMSKISMNITNTPFSEMRDIRLVMIIAC